MITNASMGVLYLMKRGLKLASDNTLRGISNRRKKNLLKKIMKNSYRKLRRTENLSLSILEISQIIKMSKKQCIAFFLKCSQYKMKKMLS
jgi:hypothetical protein